jgi:hypothetical protein
MRRVMDCPLPEPDKDGVFELKLPLGTEIKGVVFRPVEQRILPGGMIRPGNNVAQMAQQMQQMAMAPMMTIFVDDQSAMITRRRFKVIGSGAEIPEDGTFIGTASLPPHITVYIFELPLVQTT